MDLIQTLNNSLGEINFNVKLNKKQIFLEKPAIYPSINKRASRFCIIPFKRGSYLFLFYGL